MWKIKRNTKKYVENIGKYEEIREKYEGIPLLDRLWDLEKFRELFLYIGFGTLKYRLLLREPELRETRCLYEEICSEGGARNYFKSKSLYRGG